MYRPTGASLNKNCLHVATRERDNEKYMFLNSVCRLHTRQCLFKFGLTARFKVFGSEKQIVKGL